MIVATHRVVGVLEWPLGSEPSSEVLAMVSHDDQEAIESRVVSMRVPLGDQATVLTADFSQLRRDLHQLFEDQNEGSA